MRTNRSRARNDDISDEAHSWSRYRLGSRRWNESIERHAEGGTERGERDGSTHNLPRRWTGPAWDDPPRAASPTRGSSSSRPLRSRPHCRPKPFCVRVASVRSRTDSRVTAVVAASAAMVVATIPLTVPRRSLLGCRSVPVVPHRTHVRTTLLSRENLPRLITRPVVVARSNATLLSLAHSRLYRRVVVSGLRTIFQSRCAKEKLPARSVIRDTSWTPYRILPLLRYSDLRESRESASSIVLSTGRHYRRRRLVIARRI